GGVEQLAAVQGQAFCPCWSGQGERQCEQGQETEGAGGHGGISRAGWAGRGAAGREREPGRTRGRIPGPGPGASQRPDLLRWGPRFSVLLNSPMSDQQDASAYDPKAVEAAAQAHWQATGAFSVSEDPSRPKFYCL